MTNHYFGIKIKSKLAQTHSSIENLQAMLFNKERSVSKLEANYYFGIKKTSKIAQKNQSIGNSQARLLE